MFARIIKNILKFIFSKDLRIFFITSLYYIGLYFSIHNRMLLLLTAFYLIAIYLHTKNLKLSLFFTFLVTLPFAKGKALEILLLPKEQIARYSLFKIAYFFPVYFSTVFLLSIYYIYIRDKIFNNYTVTISKQVKLVAFAFVVFIVFCLLAIIYSPFYEVIVLSSLQLVVMLLIFFLPFIVFKQNKVQINYLISVLSSSVLFQSVWVFLQKLNNGPLGKDLETRISGQKFAVAAVEHSGILRFSGTFFEPSILGTFLLVHLTLFIFVLLKNNQQKHLKGGECLSAFGGDSFQVENSSGNLDKKLEIILKFTILSSLIALVFTGSRFLYLLAFFIIFIMVKNHFNVKSFISKSFVKPIIIFPLILSLVLLGPYFLSRLSGLPEVFTYGGSAHYRLQMMQYAARLGLSYPFGVGLNMSPYYFAESFKFEKFVFDPTYPHTQIFQIFAETGIIGVMIYLVFLYLIFRRFLISKSKMNEFAVAALVFLLCAQVYPIFLNHQEILSYLFLFLGLYTYSLTSKNA